MEITNEQKEALEIICDTFIPSIKKEDDLDGYWERKATDLPVVQNILNTISKLPKEDRESFVDLLDLMNSRKLGLTWLGSPRRISELTIEQRTAMLNSWSNSMIPALRGAFNSLKKLIGISYFGGIDGEVANPNWKSIQYPGPLKGTEKEINTTKGFTVKTFESNAIISCDVIVIGSGAGGGVVASELAKSGKEVIIIEKGPYVSEKDMSANETSMIAKTYDRGGAFMTVDGAVAILAGSCVGGGTTVNWSASFRTPDYILEEWAKEHDNPQFIDPEYKKCFDFIEKRANVNSELSIHNPQNKALYEGAKSLGYHAGVIPRNVAAPNKNIDSEKYWKSQGYGGLGDSFGYKMGTMKTFVQDAVDHGAKVYANTRVEQITHANGEVKGVIAYQQDKNGHQVKVTFSCEKVVVSAGALHTPAILMKSGLKHPEIGKNLYLHPTNAVTAVYDKPMEAWHGPMMSAVCDEFTQLTGNFGYKLETPPLHSGFSALSMAWESGEQYKQDMLDLKNTGVFIVLTRDKFGGQITVDKQGRTLAHYKLNKFDRNHFVHGMKEAAKIHRAAGAKKIKLLHNNNYCFVEGKDSFDHFLKQSDRITWAANRFILYSAHQMGTCRMGGRNNDHPLKPTGETREVKNLFVADASAFPRCSGVNPMLSIQAMAYYISKNIV